MKLFLFLGFLLSTRSSAAVDCESGWTVYKDEICVKSFTSLLTYDEAVAFCVSEGDETSKASLVMVKDEELQVLLANSTQDMFNTMWIGGRYDGTNYKWIDGESFQYTNWEEGYPRNSTETGCVELRPINAQASTYAEGKWADVNCEKRNLVICQKSLTWSLSDAVEEIKRMRTQLHTVAAAVVPVGSVYIEYSGQVSPPTLWPNLSWEDISSTYAGLFFRAYGETSASWGETQAECAPRFTTVNYYPQTSYQFPSYGSIPSNGWSDYIKVGTFQDPQSGEEGLQFYTNGCEVRPRNQAIRVWRRTA